jgi:predicted aspartyl protease
MLGTFNDDQPKIEIEVSGTSEHPKKITALVDSGFNGYLTLPYVEAFPLGLILKGIKSSILADGSPSEHFVCAGSVCMDGRCVNMPIDIQPGSIVLLGTKLLKELGKTFILGCSIGRVEIVDSQTK